MLPVVETVYLGGWAVAVTDANGVLWTLVDADKGQYRKVQFESR